MARRFSTNSDDAPCVTALPRTANRPRASHPTASKASLPTRSTARSPEAGREPDGPKHRVALVLVDRSPVHQRVAKVDHSVCFATAVDRAVAAPTPVERSFLARDSRVVAPQLLNKVLALDDVAARIVEVEAYAGGEDPASHAF